VFIGIDSGLSGAGAVLAPDGRLEASGTHRRSSYARVAAHGRNTMCRA
jgi:hypothetical protein